MTTKINVAGVWKDPTPSINVAGVWKTPDSIKINVAGVWKTVYTGTTWDLNNASRSAFRFGANASAHYRLTNGGYAQTAANSGSWTTVNSSTDWVIPHTAAPGVSRCRHTAVTGDTSFFVPWGAINVWFALTSTRSMYVYDSTPTAGGKQVVVTAWVDEDGDGTPAHSASITLNADREDF